ncbi:MAG: right-handed parallel beta-helix repeat-containing protein [Flavobacteriales bacterium]|nr:right-handed parallel beta-helix repeat-containing protein [Flavobacteriales bacterium]
MKLHKLILSISFALFSFMATGQTTLMGGDMSGTLTKAGSPYKIKGDIRIPKDSMLTLEAGVTLDFDSAKLIRVDGCLRSLGTAQNPNVFTCSDSLIGWLGMFFLDNSEQDTSIFEHTLFEYTGTPRSPSQSVYFGTKQHSNGEFFRPFLITSWDGAYQKYENCVFRRLWYLLDIINGSVEWNKCQFKENKMAFGLYSNGAFGSIYKSFYKFSNCKFNDNNTQGLLAGGNKSYGNLGGFVDCEIFNNGWLEIEMDNTSMPIKNCTWKNNGCYPLRLAGGNESLIENCVFDGTFGSCPNAGDIWVHGDASKSVIKNCVFKNKSSLITSITSTSGSPLILNCTFENNYNALFFNSGSSNNRVVNCSFINHEGAINAIADVVILNCNFSNNKNRIKDPFNEKTNDSLSGALVSSGGKITCYNSIFSGNTNFFGKNLNFSIWGNELNHKFYNCLFEGGRQSVNRTKYKSYNFAGLIQDCDTVTYPNFIDTANDNYHLVNNCSGLPVGFNKGYTGKIAMSYAGNSQADILAFIGQDLDGNNRIYDDTVDIGPYEINALASRIDIINDLTDKNACNNSAVTFKAKAASIGTLWEWQKSTNGTNWSFAGNKADSLLLNNVQLSDSGTQYRIKWLNACNVEKISSTGVLLVHSPVEVNLPEVDTIIQHNTKQLDAGAGFATYQWSTGATTQKITVVADQLGIGNHSFWVNTTDANGCQSTDSMVVTVTKNVGIINLHEEIEVYPNPVTDQLNVNFNGTGVYTITDLRGVVVQTGNMDKKQNTLDVSALPDNLYILKIMTEENIYVARFYKVE